MDITKLRFDAKVKSPRRAASDEYDLVPVGVHRCICTELTPMVPKSDMVPWIIQVCFVPLEHTFSRVFYTLMPEERNVSRFWEYVEDNTDLEFRDFVNFEGEELLHQLRSIMADVVWRVNITHRRASADPECDTDVVTFPYVTRFSLEV